MALDNLEYLENRFDELYSQALKLSVNPDDPAYLQIKKELDVNLDTKRKLVRGKDDFR